MAQRGKARAGAGTWSARRSPLRATLIGALSFACFAATPSRATDQADIAARFSAVTGAATWTQVAAVPLRFRTFHPQGMVRIGTDFYVSSVEVTTLPEKLEPRVDGHDRTTGAGIGHLFRIAEDGTLLADLKLGEGAIYHPGGIDFDGTSIWVPVSEYRPASRAIVYQVDPKAMRATEMFRTADHVGAIVHDVATHRLFGVDWGSRTFLTWRLGTDDRPIDPATPERTPNLEHYIDYQDCHAAGAGRMLCAGVGEYPDPPGDRIFQLGGLDLVDMRTHRPVWQIPVTRRSATGRVLTQNPAWFDARGAGLRAYFLPDDERSTLYIYDIAPPGSSGTPGRTPGEIRK